MSYVELVEAFLAMILVIKSLDPVYKQPGKGDDGTCDCIGLIIGAIIRMGLKWTGIHGSNYAARYQTYGLKKIESVDDLEVGDLVYKACEKGSTKHKWDLPRRYHKDGAYYNGDMLDYYHVGVVWKINPLKIIHMTSPKMKIDTKLNNNKNSVWNYHGKPLVLVKAVGSKVTTPTSKIKEPIASAGCEAIVTASSGSTVFCRQYPSKTCRTWERVKVGTKVTIIEPGEVWAKVNCGKRKGWYIMAEFLDVIGDGKGKY